MLAAAAAAAAHESETLVLLVPPHNNSNSSSCREHPKLRLKSGRTPLKPKTNSNCNIILPTPNPNIQLHQEWILETPPLTTTDSNKENPSTSTSTSTSTPTPIITSINKIIKPQPQPQPPPSPPFPLCDVSLSLAEELSAVRKNLERLRLDREITDRMLKERDLFMETQIKDFVYRGELQKQFEMEVDRLYRFKELKDYCLSISPIRSLRDKEQQNKKAPSSSSKETRALDLEGSVDENKEQQSPGRPSVSSNLALLDRTG
ncbi:hypothetical protein ACFE04_000348 [Oxalis oulophora]